MILGKTYNMGEKNKINFFRPQKKSFKLATI